MTALVSALIIALVIALVWLACGLIVARIVGINKQDDED